MGHEKHQGKHSLTKILNRKIQHIQRDFYARLAEEQKQISADRNYAETSNFIEELNRIRVALKKINSGAAQDF